MSRDNGSDGGARVPPLGRRLPATAKRKKDIRLVLWLLAALAVLDQWRLLWFVTRRVTNSDQTPLWYAAREWGALRPHQLNDYGQSYGSSLEAIPLEVMRRLGVRLGTATPLLLALLALSGWFLLAWAAWRSSRPALAAAALGIPTLLSAYYSFFVATVGSSLPRLFAMAGCAILLLRPPRVLVLAAAWTLVGFGVGLDGTVALLAVPVAAWYVLGAPPDRHRLLGVAAGVCLPAALVTWSWWFYRAHPDYNLHGGVSTSVSLSRLALHLGQPDRFLGLYVPELLRSWTVPFFAVAVLVVAVLCVTPLASRRLTYMVPALTVPVLVVWALATPKAGEHLGKFLPAGRIFTMLPATLWFLAFLLAESRVLRTPGWLTPRHGALAMAALTVMSFAVRNIDFGSRAAILRSQSINSANVGGYGFQPTKAVTQGCEHVKSLARVANTHLVIYLGDATSGYACAALLHGQVETLVPFWERRTWRLYDELHRRRSSFLVLDVPSRFCQFAQPRVDTCAMHPGHIALVTFAPQSALRVLSSLDQYVRPFGPQCRMKSGLFVGVYHCDHAISISPEPVGRPADEAAARRGIAAAYAAMFNLAPDRKSLPAVEDGRELTAIRRDAIHCQPFLGRANIRVQRIEFINTRQARVRYNLSDPATHSVTLVGSAVLIDDSWVVSESTFGALVGLARLQTGCGP